MIISNGYTLDILIDNNPIEFDPSQINFVLSYSIWEILPIGYLIINDQSSLLSEYYITTPGTEIKISVGIDNNLYVGDFIIDYDKIEEIETSIDLGGKFIIPLIHRWLSKQERDSIAYYDRISNVVEKKANLYKFPKTIINSTENQDYWYQLLHFDTEFIEKILLPNAYSSNSNNTPFFAYIDNYNQFNFRNLKSMNEQEHVDIILEYKPTPKDNYSNSSIYDIARKRMSYKDILDYKKIKSYIINNQTGQLENQEDNIFKYSDLKSSDKIPIRLGDDLLTNFRMYDKNKNIKDIRGEIQFDQRESLNIDNFVILIPFNPDIILGYRIPIKIYVNNIEEMVLSQYTGNYLISKITVLWDPERGTLLQKLSVIRKGDTINNEDEYILRKKLIGGK